MQQRDGSAGLARGDARQSACDADRPQMHQGTRARSAAQGSEGRFDKRDFAYVPETDEYRCPAGERAIHRFVSVEDGMTLHSYWPSACPRCPIKAKCTPSDYRRITRWEHENVLEAMQTRLHAQPDTAVVRRRTVEHVFGTLKAWMSATPFLTKTLPRVRTEMSLAVLAYNMKRMIKIMGTQSLIRAIAA